MDTQAAVSTRERASGALLRDERRDQGCNGRLVGGGQGHGTLRIRRNLNAVLSPQGIRKVSLSRMEGRTCFT